MKKIILFLLVTLSSLSCSKPALLKAEALWKNLAVQHQGRIKPFDTLARETLKKIYGKTRYENKSAVEILLLMLIVPEIWQKTPVFIVEKNLREFLGLDLAQKHFSFEELNKNQKLALQLLELQNLEEKQEELDSYFESLKKLQTRLILFSAIQTGQLFRWEASKKRDLWLSLSELSPPVQEKFKQLLKSYIGLISKKVSEDSSHRNLQKQNKNLQEEELFSAFERHVLEFQELIALNQSTQRKIKAEVWYNSLKPFTFSWLFYLLFLVVALLCFIFKRQEVLKYNVPLLFIGFAFHCLGMFLRSYIMSRPPVSNMFETVVWVPFVALIVGFLFYLKGNRWLLIASAILAFICLFLTSLAPEVLDGRLQPLEAVLRSSFWLTTHVLTITMSYSFFFLAFVVGDMILIYYLFDSKKALQFAKKMYQPIYRLIQWGVLFLTVGTLLGAVWADYSWGRFWGWDPKESWALISLLAYLAILHGKLIGWITVLNMAISVVLMFFLVIMAWYGVNFVLGAGLHSYGFGSGGIEYMLGFFILHLILCGLVFFKKR